MTLDDKFFPEDGSLLTKFDNFMIKQVGNMGDFYQNLTGNSYKELSSNALNLANKGYFLSLPLGGLYGGFKAIEYSIGQNRSPSFSTPLEEENAYESQNRNKKTGKALRTASLGLFPFLTFVGYNLIDSVEEIDSFIDYVLVWKGSGMMVSGISANIDLFSEYLSRSSLPKPPKKTIPQKVKENLESLIPKPITQQ